MSITLYDCATAPSPRRARILLAEKGVAHDTVPIDLRAGEQLGEAYRRINPQCTVPALRTDDGLTPVGSLMILDVATRGEVLALFATDPATMAGLRGKITVRFWNPAILDGVARG